MNSHVFFANLFRMINMNYMSGLVDIPVLTWAQTDEVIAKHKFDATKVEAKLKAILERQKEKG